MHTQKEQTMEPGFSPALIEEVTRAAALQGISESELLRRAAHFYALQLLAKYDALPFLRPEPWRQFRIEDEGRSVSFRVRLPLNTFSRALYIKHRIRKENGGGYCDDACEIAEMQLLARLDNLPVKNKKEREAQEEAYKQWLDAQINLAARLKEIEREVEHV